MQASPRKAAKTSIDFMLMAEKKPSTTIEPTMNRPTRTVMPTKALLFSATYRLTVTASARRPARINEARTLAAVKKPSTESPTPR